VPGPYTVVSSRPPPPFFWSGDIGACLNTARSGHSGLVRFTCDERCNALRLECVLLSPSPIKVFCPRESHCVAFNVSLLEVLAVPPGSPQIHTHSPDLSKLSSFNAADCGWYRCPPPNPNVFFFIYKRAVVLPFIAAFNVSYISK